MPEGLEAEIWRGALTSTIGRTITDGWVDDRVAPVGFVRAVNGSTIIDVLRAGKVVLVETDGPTIGLHFGMTGRVVVDGHSPIDRLEYASNSDRPEWDRLRLFTNGGRGEPAIRLNDPRRLGRVSIDAKLHHLGTDIFALTAPSLAEAISGRRAAVKPVLLDQKVVAGLGNLCADEILWWGGMDPHHDRGSLDTDEIELLATAAKEQLPIMLGRGGSTAGVLSPEVRAACPPCERDGHRLRRDSIGGRTAVWCPGHQH